MTEYLVPYANAESEFEEKRSRFISHVFLVESEAEARARIDEMKKKYYDARHNCWCFVLHDGTVRYGDDGEPQGTAGQPMLNVFQRENVENVVCIVTRYFGGILLGAGGLTRAYAKAAKDALDNAGKARIFTLATSMPQDSTASMLSRTALNSRPHLELTMRQANHTTRMATMRTM